ncbi:MAG: c-type cytochrome [Gammaproteobacteria bacterium]|nr:c-type cytochrome [Gammaproteobacteria bacterium]
MMVRALFASLALASLLASPQAAAEGDAEAGKVKAYTCMGCHGIPDYTNTYPTFKVPKVGGQYAERVVAALKAYANGERQHPTMTAQAESMTEQDMQDIAAYFATFKGSKPALPGTGDAIAGKEKSASCAACHGPDGNSPNPMYPILAGQHADYLVHSLKQYKSGARTNGVMAGMVAPLSEQDMKDIAAWFATQEGPLTTLQEENRETE